MKSFSVDVMNLSTGDIVSFINLTPKEALIATFEQQERHNYKTWEYDFNKYVINEGKLTISLGDWAVFKDGRSLER